MCGNFQGPQLRPPEEFTQLWHSSSSEESGFHYAQVTMLHGHHNCPGALSPGETEDSGKQTCWGRRARHCSNTSDFGETNFQVKLNNSPQSRRRQPHGEKRAVSQGAPKTGTQIPSKLLGASSVETASSWMRPLLSLVQIPI